MGMALDTVTALFNEMQKIAEDVYVTTPDRTSGRQAQHRARADLRRYRRDYVPPTREYVEGQHRQGNVGRLVGGTILGSLGALAGRAYAKKTGTYNLAAPILGGLAGAAGGSELGGSILEELEDQKYLRSKGIKPTMFGFGGGKFTRKATKKYLAKEYWKRPDE